MEYRLLGRSGLKISTLGLGTANFGKTSGGLALWGAVDLTEARHMVDMCLDAGVNWLDTSNAYSTGLSESVCGEILAGGRRDKMMVFTKARFPMGSGPNDRGLSRLHLIAACDASLKRLKTDHIDLYQVHQWDGQTPLEETMEALDTLVRSGKVRYIGCSNFSAWHLMKALSVSERDGRERFVSQQIHYTLEAREAEYELVPLGVDQGVSVLIWSPLAGGWLSGKFRRNKAQPKGTRVGQKFPEPPIYNLERLYDIIEVLVSVAKARKVSAAQVALAWALGRPAVSGIVLGARNAEQLKDNLAAAKLKLSTEDRAKLDKVSKPNLIYPYWHQAWTANDRFGSSDLALHGSHM